MDELLKKLTGFGVHCIGYANNIVIIVKDNYEEILCDANKP